MKPTLLLLAALAAVGAGAQTSALRVEVGGARSGGSAIESTARAFNARVALLAKNRARTWRGNLPLSFPVRVDVTRNGVVQRPLGTRAGGEITLVFATGSGAFDTEYRAFLQSVFDAVRPTLDSFFGPPVLGGNVTVRNYDAEIGDRDAVAGGIYVPNDGTGAREIRFPVYRSRTAAAINFVHTLLLAYQGTTPYALDAWQEGLARAVTARVARVPGLLPGVDATQVEDVLFNSYEVGGFYDAWNQPALAGRRFIAPNLRDEPLPAGGSNGGLYLARFRMAGAAWGKVLAQYPGLPARLNARLAADPTLANDAARLETAAAQEIAAISPSGTVEGRPFGEWAIRQRILDPADRYGPHLFVQTTPISSGLAGQDYGVFAVEATAFSKALNGDETLASGTSYPVFFTDDYTARVLPGGTAQDDRMDVAGGYGSIGPNFTDDFGGAPYRISLDLPFGDRLVRSYLPVGAVATPATQANPNDLYGTVSGAPSGVRVLVTTLDGTPVADVPVSNGAFGTRVNTGLYLGARPLRVQVRQGATVLLERQVNKAPGDLMLDLRVGEEASVSLALPGGVSAFGLPFEPYRTLPPALLGSPTQLARWEPRRAAYGLYPSTDPLGAGRGFFARTTAARTSTYPARTTGGPASVALTPGWNLISVPQGTDTAFNRVQAVTSTDFPVGYADAAGDLLGTQAFEFTPGANDPVTGRPEGGSYSPITTFRAGRAVYVRCLASDGAVILFGATAPVRSRAAGPTDRFRLRLTALAGGSSATAFAAASTTATAGFDRREDAALPPGFGGLRLAVNGNYKDVRRSGASAVEYPVALSGLTPGATVTLVFAPEVGAAARLYLLDPATGRRLMIPRTGRLALAAPSATWNLVLRAEGVR